MLAADTNILVRYLKKDDPAQAQLAKNLLDNQDVLVTTSVMLETEWVLRSLYKIKADELARALRFLAGLPHIVVEDPDLIMQAITWLEAGMDFADAIHLGKAAGCEVLITFDKDFIRAANRLGTIPVRAP
jgi:predicted nucleic-acid-binding protein